MPWLTNLDTLQPVQQGGKAGVKVTGKRQKKKETQENEIFEHRRQQLLFGSGTTAEHGFLCWVRRLVVPGNWW